MPPIWTAIEGCKSDRDLRIILQAQWGKNKRDLNTIFYDIYWGEELMKAIRTADFTRSNAATFLTSEMGLSLMQLMPRTEDERIELDMERERRKRAGKNVTLAECKAAEKAPRMPPLRWDEVLTLFTTWGKLLEMLFGDNNAHLQGLNAVRRHLLSLAETKHRYSTTYFANVVWCVLDDSVRWLNQVMPYEDLMSTADVLCLQFPTTRLHRVAEMLGMQSDYKMATFPHEWQTYAARRTNQYQHPATVSFGSGASTAGSISSGLSTITGNSRGTDSLRSGGDKTKEPQIDHNKQHREKYPDRYGRDAKNPAVQDDIKQTLAGIGNVPFTKVLDASNKSHYHLRGNNNYAQGICPAFASGLCSFRNCKAAHLLGQETPQQWAKWVCNEIEPGCVRIRSGEDIQPRSRRSWTPRK